MPCMWSRDANLAPPRRDRHRHVGGAGGRASGASRSGWCEAHLSVLKQDVIVNADVWAKRPKMMAAGLGFTNIIGVPGLTRRPGSQ
jgi:hypothetical protein